MCIRDRCTARAQHHGHGIFSETWVNGDGNEEEEEMKEEKDGMMTEMEDEDAGVGEENAAATAVTPKPMKAFKPIGAATPAVEFRWKTAEEEEREEIVADLVADAIANVVAAAEKEETTMEF